MKDYEEKVLNIMDSAKDNIKAQLDKAYKSGYEDAKSELGKNVIDFAQKENNRAYQRGLDDAWEVIQKITSDDSEGGYSCKILVDIFGTSYTCDIAQKYAPQDVIRMIKEYENKQKQDTELNVGDEVVIDDSIGIVTRAFPGAVTCYVMRKDGSSGEEDRNDCKTTGRHFDAIAEVLAEMRGEE